MNTYSIFLGTTCVACVNGTEFAYQVYKKTCELGEILGDEVSLYWDDNAECVAHFNPFED